MFSRTRTGKITMDPIEAKFVSAQKAIRRDQIIAVGASVGFIIGYTVVVRVISETLSTKIIEAINAE